MSENASRLFTLGDLVTTATLAMCAPVAWLLPDKGIKAFCRGLARLHIALRGSKAGALRGHPAVRRLDVDAATLERQFVATVYEETCYTLREHRKGGWRPSIELRGREHIDKALKAGRGVILWVSPSSYAELVVKKALFEADIPLVNLRGYVHPYSGSRWGRRFLNPIRTSVEDRYLASTVVLYPNREAVALRELQLWLRKNAVVSIFAIAAADKPLEVPCLSGTLRLAMGGPTLARLSRAPLLPVYTCSSETGGFQVTIGEPIQREGVSSPVEMAQAFADQTAVEVAQCPQVWRGWLSRSLWQPD